MTSHPDATEDTLAVLVVAPVPGQETARAGDAIQTEGVESYRVGIGIIEIDHSIQGGQLGQVKSATVGSGLKGNGYSLRTYRRVGRNEDVNRKAVMMHGSERFPLHQSTVGAGKDSILTRFELDHPPDDHSTARNSQRAGPVSNLSDGGIIAQLSPDHPEMVTAVQALVQSVGAKRA